MSMNSLSGSEPRRSRTKRSAGRKPSGGTIRFDGEDITGLRPFEINRKGLSRSFQITNIFPRMSVYENLRCAVLWSLGHGYSFLRLIDRMPDVATATTMIRVEGESTP